MRAIAKQCAIDGEVLCALKSALDPADGDPSVRVVVIAANGKALGAERGYDGGGAQPKSGRPGSVKIHSFGVAQFMECAAARA